MILSYILKMTDIKKRKVLQVVIDKDRPKYFYLLYTFCNFLVKVDSKVVVNCLTF